MGSIILALIVARVILPHSYIVVYAGVDAVGIVKMSM
jgi:hypothetical protein